ncbi:MAG: HU family DNA-binding protein [Nitrospirota bacterium]
MTKADLVNKIASDAKVNKSSAEKALNAVLDGIKGTLKKGQKVSLIGFGTFSVHRRKARKGRNPKTGTVINIPATKVPKFSAGKALKHAVK